MNDWAIIVSAGQGVRFGDDGVPKTFRPLAGLPAYVHSVRAFQEVDSIAGIVLVVIENWLEYAMEMTIREAARATIEITPGGETRQASVRAGLARVPLEAERIVVHDAARPLVTRQLIERALSGLAGVDAAICAIPLADTLKRATRSVVEETVGRDDLWRVQTPQAFIAKALREAHASAPDDDATDDAALIEARGGRVVIVPGDERNIKITTTADLELAEALMLGTRV
ncbi:MAG TPA: 2-C-methyl-D-erythritol 4-phosphate cytidylyltransferase [Actinomycetota bacterium]|nr:2-C-methyl-D-erythritol 4-phosphate cytidylyltransferase [Actinomycetota bacterium]